MLKNMKIVSVRSVACLPQGSTNQKWFLNMEEVHLKSKEIYHFANSVPFLLVGALTVGPLSKSTTRMANKWEPLCKDVAITFYANMISRYTKVMMLLKVLFSEQSTDVYSIATHVVQLQDVACVDKNSISMLLIDSDNLRMN
jgi:hypothetical protein